MDATTALAFGCAGAALALLVLQQLFVALAVSAFVREGRTRAPGTGPFTPVCFMEFLNGFCSSVLCTCNGRQWVQCGPMMV